MSEFEPIELRHKALFDMCQGWESTLSSGSSFGNVFLWDLYCRRNVALLGERLGVEFLCPHGPFFAYPSGRGDLAEAVEARDKTKIQDTLDEILHGYAGGNYDAVVLGCTHYVLIKDEIQKMFAGAKLYDGNNGVAKKVKAILEEQS